MRLETIFEYFHGNITNHCIYRHAYLHTNSDFFLERGMNMGRGKSFDHKKKGHDHQPPKGAFIHKDVNEHTLEEEELPVNIETYKNSLKKH